MPAVYKRILLKLSGEALAGDRKFGLDFDNVLRICASIKKCVDLGAQVGVVVGGGNFFRGRDSGNMDRTRADHMGVLATVMNSLSLADALEAAGIQVRVQTAITMQQIADIYSGKITNWSEIGGVDANIAVVARDSASGTGECFEDAMVAVDPDYELMPGVPEMVATNSVLEFIKSTPGSIGYVSIGSLADL